MYDYIAWKLSGLRSVATSGGLRTTAFQQTMMWLDAKTALTKGGTVEGMSEQMLELRARL
jgi:hypothetical protein